MKSYKIQLITYEISTLHVNGQKRLDFSVEFNLRGKSLEKLQELPLDIYILGNYYDCYDHEPVIAHY